MIAWLSTFIVLLYVTVSFLLSVYGLNQYLLVAWRKRAPPVPAPRRIPRGEEPVVTVQLPIFNERYVLPRLLEAAAALDWPRDRLEIQILDDSTDDTREMAAALAAEYRASGVDVKHVTRGSREGFKAGALQAGLASARGSLIAIFDSDFVPHPDFLRATVPHFARDVACVQARWAHTNEEYSWLTRATAIGIDGHFSVEQRARASRGYLLNFNGTAGVWRRDAMVAAGGWSGSTLAEDLDLSFHVQLAGWRLVYLEDVEAPAEIPVQVHAFKRQQARWAQGSIQCARKHLGAVWRSPRLTVGAKVQATLHLTHYAVHPLLLALYLLLIPAMFASRFPLPITWIFLVATFGPPTLYAVGQRIRHPEDWRRRARRLLPLTLIGTGVAVSNARAVFAGLFKNGGEFRRTPKFRIEHRSDSWRDKEYALAQDWTTWLEGAFAALGVASLAVAIATRNFFVIPWILLFGGAFGTMFFLSLAHRIRAPRAEQEGHERVEAPRGEVVAVE
ncbi:MAG: glycosyltransferase [Thermoplasmatota archaeon]